MDTSGYRWEVKKVVNPGESEPVIQMHLVPTDKELAHQRLAQAQYMKELESTGFIRLPSGLAAETGITEWDPRNQEQTRCVLVAMSNDGTLPEPGQ